MIKREKVHQYIEDTYSVEAEFPWQKHPGYAVYRHNSNDKWFALMMNITPDKLGLVGEDEIQVINVKVNNEYIGILRKKKGIYPAYHMNKSHWISINLDEFDDLEELNSFIDESYELTQ